MIGYKTLKTAFKETAKDAKYKVTVYHLNKLFPNGSTEIIYNISSSIETEELYFKNKEDAWAFFSNDMGPIGMHRDIWLDFDWDDKQVVSVRVDNGGETYTVLDKWEDFDEDIDMRWVYNGTPYRSLEELREEHPQFINCHVSDKPFIMSKYDSIKHPDIAELFIYDNLNVYQDDFEEF